MFITVVSVLAMSGAGFVDHFLFFMSARINCAFYNIPLHSHNKHLVFWGRLPFLLTSGGFPGTNLAH